MHGPAVTPERRSVRLRFDGFDLDETEARLTHVGEPVPLAPKPFAALCVLARTPSMLVTKHALLKAVWGHQFVTDSVLKTAISEVRAALRDDPKQPRYIETVSRHGYRFIGPVLGGLPIQGARADDRSGASEPGHLAVAALTALCRSDAMLADLIRAVAATLECERPNIPSVEGLA
jgi:DNA-binding winged helix-turn-helix (wHTH) protein